MYTINSLRYGWWENVTLIIWGDTANLAANDPEIQELIREAIASGVNVRACKRCVEDLGHLDILETLGIDVVYLGQGLTEYLKDERYVLLSI